MDDYKLGRPEYMTMTVVEITRCREFFVEIEEYRERWVVKAICEMGGSIEWVEDEMPEYEVGQKFSIAFKWEGVE